MKAIVKKDFYHAKKKKGFKIGDVFSADKNEIERINNALKGALEIQIQKIEPVQRKSRKKK
jgi:hypothetical protein